MSKVSKPTSAGFTVVETIIVLAIAGLILLIVLLAIPTLTRSSRNNQRRQDVQTVLQAVSHYELNNSGTVPSPVQLQNFLNTYEKGKLTYYPLGSITICPATPVQNPPYCSASDITNEYANQSTLDTMIIYNHAKCTNSNNGNYTNAGAGYSDVVASYRIETGSGTSPQCEQL